MSKSSYVPSLLCLIIFSINTLQAYSEDETHKWTGTHYHQNSSSQKDAAKALLATVTLDKDSKILDIGCGDGKITAELAQSASKGKVVGLDLSESMICFAKETYEGKHPNLTFILRDFHDLAVEEEFDAVLSFTALQWAKDHRQVIREVSKILKNNGTFAVTMPMGLPEQLHQSTQEVIQKEKWSSYFHNFSTGWNFSTPQEYQQLLEEQDFSIVRLEKVPQHDTFPSREVFRGFISQWFPYLRPIPEKDKQLFMSEVINNFLAREPLDAEGRVHFKIFRLEAQAQKIS